MTWSYCLCHSLSHRNVCQGVHHGNKYHETKTTNLPKRFKVALQCLGFEACRADHMCNKGKKACQRMMLQEKIVLLTLPDHAASSVLLAYLPPAALSVKQLQWQHRAEQSGWQPLTPTAAGLH